MCNGCEDDIALFLLSLFDERSLLPNGRMFPLQCEAHLLPQHAKEGEAFDEVFVAAGL
jgi:hypothetical protein